MSHFCRVFAHCFFFFMLSRFHFFFRTIKPLQNLKYFRNLFRLFCLILIRNKAKTFFQALTISKWFEKYEWKMQKTKKATTWENNSEQKLGKNVTYLKKLSHCFIQTSHRYRPLSYTLSFQEINIHFFR